jgi:hypothetical protein
MVIIAIIKSEALLTLLASPLSEIAYQLANTGAGAIDTQNTAVATAFGISGVDRVFQCGFYCFFLQTQDRLS